MQRLVSGSSRAVTPQAACSGAYAVRLGLGVVSAFTMLRSSWRTSVAQIQVGNENIQVNGRNISLENLVGAEAITAAPVLLGLWSFSPLAA